MKEVFEKYRRLGQNTVQGKTTKDKAGAQSVDCTKDNLEREAEHELAPQHAQNMIQLTFVDDSSTSCLLVMSKPHK